MSLPCDNCEQTHPWRDHSDPDIEAGTTFEMWGAFVAEVARTEVRVYDGANPDASMTLARLVEKAQSLIDPTTANNPGPSLP